jgi:hypothetical protein
VTLFVDSIETERDRGGEGAGVGGGCRWRFSSVRRQWARPNLTEIEGRWITEITVEDGCSTARITHIRGGGNQAIPNPNVEYSLVAIVTVRASMSRILGKMPFRG